MLLGGLWSFWIITLAVATTQSNSPTHLHWEWYDRFVFVVALLPGWGPWVWLFRQRAAVHGQFAIRWRRAPLQIRSITPQIVEVQASARPNALKLLPLACMLIAILTPFQLQDPAHPLLIMQ